jgi:hypothetical protein
MFRCLSPLHCNMLPHVMPPPLLLEPLPELLLPPATPAPTCPPLPLSPKPLPLLSTNSQDPVTAHKSNTNNPQMFLTHLPPTPACFKTLVPTKTRKQCHQRQCCKISAQPPPHKHKKLSTPPPMPLPPTLTPPTIYTATHHTCKGKAPTSKAMLPPPLVAPKCHTASVHCPPSPKSTCTSSVKLPLKAWA